MLHIAITETTNTGLPSSYGYSRKCMRVVIKDTEKSGWKSEKETVVLFESDHYNANSTGPKSNYTKIYDLCCKIVTEIYEQHGLSGMPDSVLSDWLEENGNYIEIGYRAI